MKTKHVLLSMIFGLMSLAAYKDSDEILGKLGLSAANAQSAIIANITESRNAEEVRSDMGTMESNFVIPYTKLLPSVIQGDKVGAAKELCAYIKKYCNSEEFAAEYSLRREKSKPTSEPPKMDQETIDNLRKNIRSMETDLAEARKNEMMKPYVGQYEEGIAAQKAMLAQWEDPTPNKTEWERRYPADPAVRVKKRLEDYLELVTTVDFSAKLTGSDTYKVKKFVNLEYEAKSAEWKACYRAGKEVNAVMTAFVREWLKGEIIATNKIRMTVARDKEPENGKVVTKDEAARTMENGNASETDDVQQGAKPKKSLLNKMRDKAKEIIKD